MMIIERNDIRFNNLRGFGNILHKLSKQEKDKFLKSRVHFMDIHGGYQDIYCIIYFLISGVVSKVYCTISGNPCDYKIIDKTLIKYFSNNNLGGGIFIYEYNTLIKCPSTI